jgi:tetratricopeptide (TPR) repeat protein
VSKKIFPAFVIIFFISAAWAFSDVQDIAGRADKLNEEENYKEEKNVLLDSLETVRGDSDSAELYWRLARATLNIGDETEKSGAGPDMLLEIFEEGESYASRSIELDPGNHLGYFWKSANIGRWGQIKGVLNALRKADKMKDLLETAVTLKPDHAVSFYVLGQLYDQVPGFPISFGNADYSVSLGRKAIELHEEQYRNGTEKKFDYDYYNELAKHLYKRNWTLIKRKREHGKKNDKHKAETGILGKSIYYEGTIKIKNITDREEARDLLEWVITELEGASDRTKEQNDNLKEAKETIDSW